MHTVVAIATTNDRAKTLRNTIESLRHQVDEIFVYNNDKKLINLYDNAKFLYCDIFSSPVYYLTCDSDIIYPFDYVNTMKDQIEKHKCIISYHGRVLSPDAQTYYGYGHKEMRYFQYNDKPFELDVAGTGVTGFRTDYFCPDIANSEYKRMSDLVFSLEAIKQGKKIISPEKKHLLIKGQEVKSSIFAEEKNGTQENQIKLMKEILWIKNEQG